MAKCRKDCSLFLIHVHDICRNGSTDEKGVKIVTIVLDKRSHLAICFFREYVTDYDGNDRVS